MNTLLALCRKNWNLFRILSKKVKHFLHFVKKNWNIFRICSEKMKHFSHLVKKSETFFALCQKKLKHFLQLVKKIEMFFATFWISKEILHLSYMFENFFANVFDNGDFCFAN